MPWLYGPFYLQVSPGHSQPSKKVSDSPGLLDFAIRLVNYPLNLLDGQVKRFGEFKLRKNCSHYSSNDVFGLVEKRFGLVHASCSRLEWQAIKLKFQPRKKPEPQQNYITRILWIKRLYTLL